MDICVDYVSGACAVCVIWMSTSRISIRLFHDPISVMCVGDAAFSSEPSWIVEQAKPNLIVWILK